MVVQDPERVLAACRSQPAVAAEGLEDRNAGLVEPNEALQATRGELVGRRPRQIERHQPDEKNDSPAQQQPAAAVPGGGNPRAPRPSLDGGAGRRGRHQILATKSDSPGMSRRCPLTPLTMHMMRKTTKTSQMIGARIMITQPTPGIMLSTK